MTGRHLAPEDRGRWVADPEVRAWLYGIATAAVPILVVLGVVRAEHGGLWLALVGAILAPAATGMAAANTTSGGGGGQDGAA